MKLKTLALSIALATSLNSYAADPIVINVNDVQYSVNYATGNFDTLQNSLEGTPWWGNVELATAIIDGHNLLFPDYRPNDGGARSPFAVTGLDTFDANVPNPGFRIVYNVAFDNGQGGFEYYTFEGSYDGGFTDDSFVFFLGQILAQGPSAIDTLASMQPNASAMKNAFNRQYSQLAYGLNHDCTIFDANNICVSVFGRQTNMSDSSYDSSAAGLVLAYKPHAQFRMGAYIDQTLSHDTTAGVELERSNPDFGVFGVWNQQADGSGLQLRAAANYGKRDINVSRMVVGDSSAEAGRGKSDLNAYGALFEASYAFALNDMWSAKPYAGVRYLSIKRDSYSESMTDDVANPLSYAGLEQETTSAIAGIRLNGQLTPKVIASMNVGIEHDLDHSIDDYRATGVDDLGRINMDSQEDKTRPTAGLGLSYDVSEKQRISAAVQYRKEIFMSESSTTGQITYTIGF